MKEKIMNSYVGFSFLKINMFAILKTLSNMQFVRSNEILAAPHSSVLIQSCVNYE